MHRCTEKCAVNCEFSDNQCSICLGKHDNKSFVNGCFHAFCFVCLKEWSKVKNVCPLCKQEFKSILHNVKSLDDYEEYTLPDPNADIDGHPADGRFRYRTTMTNEWLAQREHQRIEREILSLLSRPSITTRNHWRRRRQTATSEHRRQIYSNGMFVKEVRATNGRLYQTRDISPEWFWTHPASTHRLVPWLNRELNVLMTSETDRQFVLDLILELIQTIDIQSEAFDQQLRSFLGRKTRHFIHEFYTFAKSPYDMIKYDQCAVYDDSSNPPEVTLSSNSDNSTDEMSDTEDAVVFVGRKHKKGLFPGDSETPSQSAAGPSETATREQTNGPSCSYISENSATNVSRGSRGHYTVCTAAASGSDNGSRTCAMSEMKAYSNILMPSTSYSAPSNLSNQRLTLPFEVLDLPSTSQTAASATATTVNDVSNEISVDSDSDIEIVQVEKNWGERSPILLSSGDDEDVQVISDDKKDAHIDSRVKSHAHHKSKKHKKKKHKKLKKRKERDEDYRKRRHKYDRSERARSSSSYDRERRKHSKTRRRKHDLDGSQRSSSRDVREGHSSRKRTYDSESDDNYRKRRKEKHHSYSGQSTHSDNGHRHRHRERRERSQSHKHSPRKRDNVANAAHPKNNVDIFFTCSSSDSGEPTKLKSVIGSKLTSLNVQTETKAETLSDKTSGNCSLADDSSKDHALNTNSQENTIEVNVIKDGKPAECDLTEYIDVEKVDIDDISCNGEVGDCSDMKSSFEDQTLPCAEPTVGDNDITMMDISSIMPKSTDVEKVETGVANSEKVSEVKNGSSPDQSNKDTNDVCVDKNSAEYIDVEKDSSDDKRTVEKSDSEEIVCIKEVTASNIDAAEENHHDLQNANADDSSTSAKIAKKWKKNSSGHKN